MQYKLLAASYATIPELYEMYDQKLDGVIDNLNFLKMFQRPWTMMQIVSNVDCLEGKKTLGVGDNLDILPSRIFAAKYKANAYVLDKIGDDENLDKSRHNKNNTVEELEQTNPLVTYVHGLAGNYEEHKIQDATFDCIYSISVLEHVPKHEFIGVLNDLDRMLKPGGIQVHTIDIPVDVSEDSLQFYKDCFSTFINTDELLKFEQVNLVEVRTNPMTFYEPADTLKRYWFPHKERKDVQYQRWTSFNIAMVKNI
jgi:phospholipid N-methyltransferase